MPNFPLPPAKTRAPLIVLHLDGVPHTLTVTWNVSAQRRYFNLYDHTGVWVCTKPLIETGPGLRISTIVYRKGLRSMLVTLGEPCWRPLGQIVEYTLENVDPAWLNGPHRCEVVGRDQFLFFVRDNPVETFDPGQINLHGRASRYCNLGQGYLESSILIFRNQQFEVTDGGQRTQIPAFR